MDPSLSTYSTWEQRVYDIAQKNGITVKSWTDFRPQAPILRQELFVIATRLNAWSNTTGGCSTHTMTNNPTSPTVIPVLLPSMPTSNDTLSGSQSPGTFAFLYENETEKIYAYIVKSGGIPDGVRSQYIRTFS